MDIYQLVTVMDLIFKPSLWARTPHSFRCLSLPLRYGGSCLLQTFTSSGGLLGLLP